MSTTAVSSEAIPVAFQPELLLPRLPDTALRDDRALMEFPWFSISKSPSMEPIVYEDAQCEMRVTPGLRGMPTIWDKDVLIYACSLLNDAVERGEDPPPRTIRFYVSDFLRSTRRSDGGISYSGFEDMLFRLRSATVTIGKEVKGRYRASAGFGWLDSYSMFRDDGAPAECGESPTVVEITLSHWIYQGIIEERRVLAISPNYFRLTSGIERRLYELARKHLGRQTVWSINIGRLAEKIGITSTLPKFREELQKLARRGNISLEIVGLPGRLRTPVGRQTVVFSAVTPSCG